MLLTHAAVLPKVKVRINMLRVDNNRVVKTGHLKNLGIEIRVIRIVKRNVETLLRLKRSHEIAVHCVSTSLYLVLV